MWVKCVLVCQPLPSIFGLVNTSNKKIRLKWRLHPSHVHTLCAYCTLFNLSSFCLLSILYVLNYFKYSRTFHITLGPILLTFFLTCVTSEMHFAKLTIIISSEMGSAFSHNDTMMSSTFFTPISVPLYYSAQILAITFQFCIILWSSYRRYKFS